MWICVQNAQRKIMRKIRYWIRISKFCGSPHTSQLRKYGKIRKIAHNFMVAAKIPDIYFDFSKLFHLRYLLLREIILFGGFKFSQCRKIAKAAIFKICICGIPQSSLFLHMRNYKKNLHIIGIDVLEKCSPKIFQVKVCERQSHISLTQHVYT